MDLDSDYLGYCTFNKIKLMLSIRANLLPRRNCQPPFVPVPSRVILEFPPTECHLLTHRKPSENLMPLTLGCMRGRRQGKWSLGRGTEQKNYLTSQFCFECLCLFFPFFVNQPDTVFLGLTCFVIIRSRAYRFRGLLKIFGKKSSSNKLPPPTW